MYVPKVPIFTEILVQFLTSEKSLPHNKPYLTLNYQFAFFLIIDFSWSHIKIWGVCLDSDKTDIEELKHFVYTHWTLKS